MTPEERAQKIKEIRRAQMIDEIRSAGGDPNQPPVEAIGSPDGEQPSMAQQALHKGAQGLGATAKALDVLRGSTTGPALAMALEAMTGKKVASIEDWKNAINPTNLKTFPTANEMYERAGVPEGAKMSDYFNKFPLQYAEPSKDNPWYVPEKGGALDFTVRGAGGTGTDILIDPATYLSFGAASAGRKAAMEGAARMVARESAGPVGKAVAKAGDVLNMATTPLRKGYEAVGKVPYVGPVVNRLATAPSDMTDWVGKKLYNSTILPIEHEGEKFGKEAVGQTVYDLGIANPLDMSEKTQEGANKLMDKAGRILKAAGDAGGRVDMNAALNRARETMQEIRAKGNPKQQWIADQLEREIKTHEEMVAGKAAVPETTKVIDTGLVDASGNPITKEVKVPGSPEVPGREITPAHGMELKTDQYKATPDAVWNELKQTPEGAKVTLPMSQGLKEESLRAVERPLGPEAAQMVDELHGEAGKLLSTRNAARNVEKQADRLAHGAVSPTGTAKVMVALKGLEGMLMDMGGNAARLGTMPLGYGVRKLSEGQLTGPMIDAYLRRKAVEGFNQGGENGQER